MCQTLQLDTFEGADFKYDNIVSNSSQKYQNQECLALFWEINKLEDADFKYGNSSIFQVPAKKYPNNIFLIPNLSGFFFCLPNFSRRQIWGFHLKYKNTFFEFQLQNICVFSGVSGPKFRHFGFSSNFANRKTWGCWFQIWQDCFQILV